MKNTLLVGALAMATACLSGEQASAWINSQFGMGLNWNWASGGNCLGWGLFRDGQPGGPEVFHSFQSTPAYPQPAACAPTYPTQPNFAPAPAPSHHHCAPIPVPAVSPTSAPTAATPASSTTQSLYRPYGRPQVPAYNYYYQPRR